MLILAGATCVAQVTGVDALRGNATLFECVFDESTYLAAGYQASRCSPLRHTRYMQALTASP